MEGGGIDRMVDWKLPNTVAYINTWQGVSNKTVGEIKKEMEQGLAHEPGVETEVIHGEWSKVEDYMKLLQEHPYRKKDSSVFSPWSNSSLIHTMVYQIYVPNEDEGGVKSLYILNTWHPRLESQAEVLDGLVYSIQKDFETYDMELCMLPAPVDEPEVENLDLDLDAFSDISDIEANSFSDLFDFVIQDEEEEGIDR